MKEKSHGMKKEFTVLAALVAVIIVAFLFVGQMGGNTASIIDSSAEQENIAPAISLAAEQENSEGPVTISIQYLDSKDTGDSDSLAFQVTITTHSVDLDQYNIDKLAVLKDGQGNVYTPSKWTDDQGSGGHHRSGILYFDLAGNAIIDSNDKFFEVEIYEIGDVPVRSFRWDL